MDDQFKLDRDPAVQRGAQVYVSLILFSCAGTVLSTVFKVDPGPIRPVAATLTLLSAVFTLVHILGGRKHAVLAMLGVMAIGATAEIVGLFTGLPFGRYEYTKAWWPTVPLGTHQFPLLLPFAWFMVVAGSYLLVRTRGRGWVTVLWTGLIAALIDLPMEPAMTDMLKYWRWSEKGPLLGAPWTNFLGWFAVASLAAVLLHRLFEFAKPPGRVAGLILMCHVLLMSVQISSVHLEAFTVGMFVLGFLAVCLPMKR